MSEHGRRAMSSRYMRWAKTRPQGARFNLASSGLDNYPLSELSVRVEDLELSGASYYGYAPLQRLLSAKCDAPPECVVAAAGTSMANHLAMAALLEPGDEALIEHPTYELLTSVAEYLGAEVKRFPRPFEGGFRINLEEIERRLSPRTGLVVVTNLHNPSSALADDETLKSLGAMARGVGARVLVDEVYLDALFEHTPRSAFHLGSEFVTTNSLTKVYGLSGLRCGWILAAPELARRMWQLNDLFGVLPAHAAERLSCIALENLERLAARARHVLDANKQVLNSFFSSRTDLDWTQHEFGTVAFPRLRKGDADAFTEMLFRKYETLVVPGKFFEMPQHFRIGIGGETAALAEGLRRLGMALDEIQ